MILLANPPATDKFLANGSTPILMPHRPAIVINNNFSLQKRHIVTEGLDMNGFVLPNCQVDVCLSMYAIRNVEVTCVIVNKTM